MGDVRELSLLAPGIRRGGGGQCVEFSFAQRLSKRSETIERGAGCGSSARPDLWEPREGNFPGPPDRWGQRLPNMRSVPFVFSGCRKRSDFGEQARKALAARFGAGQAMHR